MKDVVAGCDHGVGQHAVHADGTFGAATAFYVCLQPQTRNLRLGFWGTSLVA
jgi:hypothetical protein